MFVIPSIIRRIIAEETFKHKLDEFGGWVIFNKENNLLEDIIIDVASKTDVAVELSPKNIIKLPQEMMAKVNGWFHSHPINDLSGKDIDTMNKLTKFWGNCYTVVLQYNKRILIVNTTYEDNQVKENYRFEVPIGYETYKPKPFDAYANQKPVVVPKKKKTSKPKKKSTKKQRTKQKKKTKKE
jgi:proteasome lid subunit RPN8/RPN11